MTGARPQHGEIAAEQPVIGPEIVAPLRNAMRFIDGDEGRFALREHLGKTTDAQTLRGDKQELQSAVEIVDADLARSGAIAPGMDASTAKPSSRSLAYWSSISAMRGLITRVVPPRARPGNW